MQITAKVLQSEARPNIAEDLQGSIEYDLGESIQDPVKRINYLAEKFGAAAIVNKFEDAVIVELQAMIRRSLVTGEKDKATPSGITQEDLQAKADEHKVGAGRKKGKSLEDKYLDNFDDMTPEQQQAAVARLQAKIASGKA